MSHSAVNLRGPPKKEEEEEEEKEEELEEVELNKGDHYQQTVTYTSPHTPTTANNVNKERQKANAYRCLRPFVCE